jgi:hypothetical protein
MEMETVSGAARNLAARTSDGSGVLPVYQCRAARTMVHRDILVSSSGDDTFG